MSKRQKDRKNQSNETEIEKEKKNTVAFVLCHPFACSMSPINGELPPCLFPLCNSPVLLYVLNWLSVNGIEKIYILCRNSDEEIISHVTKQCATRMLMENIEIVPSLDPVKSIGDCIRVIDSWNQQFNAFDHCIVVPGTLVTNVPLEGLIDAHIRGCNDRHSEDGYQQVITSVFTQGNKYDSYSVIEGSNGMVLDIKPTNQDYFDFINVPLRIDPKQLKKAKNLRIRTCLHDANIYILSAQAFLDFGDQFDWNDVCKDCIPTQLHLLELTKHTTHMKYFPDSFAQTIDDLPSYISTSLALIRRWLHPVTVEMNFFTPHETSSVTIQDFYDDDEEDVDEYSEKAVSSKQVSDKCTTYRLKRDLVYLYDDVYPSLSAKIGHSVVIGKGTQVEDNVVIKNSVIGSGCVIGKNSVLNNCIVWDRVQIGEGVKMDHCLIASDVTISDGVTIKFGSIISFNCNIFFDIEPCRRFTINDEILPNGLFETPNDTKAFQSEEVPQWLSQYVDNKIPLEFDEDRALETGTQEFFPTPTHEIPLLRMWHELINAGILPAKEFPIDKCDILYSSDDVAIEEEEEEEEFEVNQEEIDDVCPIQLNEDFKVKALDIIVSTLERMEEKGEEEATSLFQEIAILKNKILASNGQIVTNVDVAVAFILGIIEHYGLDNCEEGIDLFEEKFYEYLSESNDQVDVLFWWQWYCARDEENRTDIFVKVLIKLLDESIIEEEAEDEWSEQQIEEDEEEEMNDSTKAQKRLFDAFKKQSQ